MNHILIKYTMHDTHIKIKCVMDIYTGWFISPSGISELDCATNRTDTAERSISIGRESLQVLFVLGVFDLFHCLFVKYVPNSSRCRISFFTICHRKKILLCLEMGWRDSNHQASSDYDAHWTTVESNSTEMREHNFIFKMSRSALGPNPYQKWWEVKAAGA
jgi:hypothetical protein